MKRHATDQVKIFAIHISDKHFVSRRYKELLQPNKKIFKQSKDLKTLHMRMTKTTWNKVLNIIHHWKILIQILTTMRYHYISNRMA